MSPETTVQFDLSRIRLERMLQKLTAYDMADALGISANAYYKKERGTTNISVNEFSTVLAFLNIPSGEIHRFFIYHETTETEKGS